MVTSTLNFLKPKEHESMVEIITLIIERPGVSSVGSGRATPIYVRQQWETHAGRARVGSNSIQLLDTFTSQSQQDWSSHQSLVCRELVF